jgi:hypothetical protein
MQAEDWTIPRAMRAALSAPWKRLSNSYVMITVFGLVPSLSSPGQSTVQ